MTAPPPPPPPPPNQFEAELNRILDATPMFRLPQQLAEFAHSSHHVSQVANDLLEERIQRLCQFPAIYVYAPTEAEFLVRLLDRGWPGYASVFTHLSDQSPNPLYGPICYALDSLKIPYHAAPNVIDRREREFTPIMIADEMARNTAEGSSTQMIPYGPSHHSGGGAESSISVGARRLLANLSQNLPRRNPSIDLGSLTPRSITDVVTSAISTGLLHPMTFAQALSRARSTGTISPEVALAFSQAAALIIAPGPVMSQFGHGELTMSPPRIATQAFSQGHDTAVPPPAQDPPRIATLAVSQGHDTPAPSPAQDPATNIQGVSGDDFQIWASGLSPIADIGSSDFAAGTTTTTTTTVLGRRGRDDADPNQDQDRNVRHHPEG